MAKRLLLGFISLALFFIFNLPLKAHAEGSDVIFNEIMWRGSSVSSSDEWIELKNLSQNIIDISGWTIEDQISQKRIIIENGQIPPSGYFLIANNSKDHVFSKGRSILNIDPDIISSSLSLSNSQLKLNLRDKNDEIIDRVGNGKAPFIGEFDEHISSMQRLDGEGSESSSWTATNSRLNLDEDCLDYATPENSGKPIFESITLANKTYQLNSKLNLVFDYRISDTNFDVEKIKISLLHDSSTYISKDYQPDTKNFSFENISFCPSVLFEAIDKTGLSTSQLFTVICSEKNYSIKISELMIHPNKDWNSDGQINSSDEWIELNNTSDKIVDLAGWTITDLSGKAYPIKGKINPNDFLVIFSIESSLRLNDDEEILILTDPFDEPIDKVRSFDFQNEEDISYSRISDDWQFSTLPTPGFKNILQTKNIDQKSELTAPNIGTAINDAMKELPVLANTKLDVIKKIITVKKIQRAYFLNTVYKLKRNGVLPIEKIVMGYSNQGSNPLNRFRNLLYLSGIFIQFILIYSYEFYRRE